MRPLPDVDSALGAAQMALNLEVPSDAVPSDAATAPVVMPQPALIDTIAEAFERYRAAATRA